MSRDHYKGIPKKVQVFKTSKGRLETLNKPAPVGGEIMSAGGFITVPPDQETVHYVYANSSGNDSSGTGTKENPYRTFRKCLERIPNVLNNSIWYVNITGLGEEVFGETVAFPQVSSGFLPRLNYSMPVENPVYYYRECAVNVIADPIIVDTLVSPQYATQITTSLRTVTDSTKSWVPGEHKGKFLQGDTAKTAVIYDNTATTLYVTRSSNLTGTLTIVEPSATLTYGGGAEYLGMTLMGLSSSILFSGIKFKNPPTNNVVTVYCDGNSGTIYFKMCDFEKGVSFLHGGYNVVDSCVVRDKYAQDGTAAVIRTSLFKNSTFSVHGTGGAGLDSWSAVRFENMVEPIGHGGNAEPEVGFTLSNCSISGSTTAGLYYRGSTTCRLSSCEFIDCASTAIYAESPGRLRVLSVSGSGNAGYGIYALNGAHIEVNAGTIITGDLGDFKVGVLPVNDWTTFNAGFKATLDTTAVSGTLSRLYNQTSY